MADEPSKCIFFEFPDNTDNDVFEDDYLHISEDSPSTPPNDTIEERITKTITITRSPRPKRTNIPSVPSGSKPKFLKLFESVQVNEGCVLLLTCQAVGEPMPDLIWYKDGRELKSNTRISISHSSNGASSLYIARAFTDDAGVYQVTATNDYGISVYHADIYVKRKPIFELF